MESCLYDGVVRHERLQPVNHRFHYRLYMVFLDLAEVPGLTRAGVLSAGRFAPAGFLRRDHFGDPRQPLEQSVRELVGKQTGMVTAGPIRLLTQLRTFGCYFSPLNLFFCHASDGRTLNAIVAEVQNTPWFERHCYVLWGGNQVGSSADGNYRHRKAFHVSPFLNMDMEYRWRMTSPGELLGVAIENASGGDVLFRAALRMRRSPLSRRALLTMQCRCPLMPARIMAAIYFQAFQLWRKKCPLHPHPRYQTETARLLASKEPPVRESSTVSAANS
jgi:DUF1365 family protein